LIITSHDLYELTQLAERLVLIDQGKLFFEGTTQEILGRCQFKKVSFKCDEPQQVDQLQGLEEKEISEKFVKAWTRDSDDLIRQLVQKNIPFSQLAVESGDLSEIFRIIRGQA